MTGTLLTTAEVAEILGRQPRQVARYAVRGELPYAYRHPGLRGAFLFDESVVVMFKASWRDKRFKQNRVNAA